MIVGISRINQRFQKHKGNSNMDRQVLWSYFSPNSRLCLPNAKYEWVWKYNDSIQNSMGQRSLEPNVTETNENCIHLLQKIPSGKRFGKFNADFAHSNTECFLSDKELNRFDNFSGSLQVQVEHTVLIFRSTHRRQRVWTTNIFTTSLWVFDIAEAYFFLVSRNAIWRPK